MIRNVRIHVNNEQPLMADLFAMPHASDAGLVCTNLRTMDGKRPVFIDEMGSLFFFPYHVVRFLEIPEGAMDAHDAESGDAPVDRAWQRPAPGAPLDRPSAGPGPTPSPEPGSPPRPGIPSGAIVAVPAADPDELDLDLDIELDEGLMQRIRDI